MLTGDSDVRSTLLPRIHYVTGRNDLLTSWKTELERAESENIVETAAAACFGKIHEEGRKVLTDCRPILACVLSEVHQFLQDINQEARVPSSPPIRPFELFLHENLAHTRAQAVPPVAVSVLGLRVSSPIL